MAIASAKDMTPSTKFWHKTARKYAASKIKDQAAYETTLRRTTAHLKPGDNVLELGCGTGSTALLLAENVQSYLATDFAPGMIEIANEKLISRQGDVDQHGNLSFLTADAFDKELETPNGRSSGYDVILAFNFFHLVERPEHLLQRIRQLLKPGGLYISKTVCLKDKAWLFYPMIKVMQLFGKAPFVNVFSFEDVERMIGEAGFEILEAGTYPEPRSRFIVARKT